MTSRFWFLMRLFTLPVYAVHYMTAVVFRDFQCLGNSQKCQRCFPRFSGIFFEHLRITEHSLIIEWKKRFDPFFTHYKLWHFFRFSRRFSELSVKTRCQRILEYWCVWKVVRHIHSRRQSLEFWGSLFITGFYRSGPLVRGGLAEAENFLSPWSLGRPAEGENWPLLGILQTMFWNPVVVSKTARLCNKCKKT